jgi:hypothetical protein
MANVRPIDKPVFDAALVDGRGYVSQTWRPWFQGLRSTSVTAAGNSTEITLLEEGLALTNAQLLALTARVTTAEQAIRADQAAIAALQVLSNSLLVTSNAHTLELANHEARIEALETYRATFPIKEVSADYALVYADFTVEVDCTAADTTITLPAAGALVTGEFHNVTKVDSSAHTLTLDGNGKLIDGFDQVLVTDPDTNLQIQFDGAAWRIL